MRGIRGVRLLGTARAAGVLIVVGVLAAACGSGGGRSSSGSGSNGPVRLTIGTFGDFGYKELYQRYMKLHPNITIVEHVVENNAHHQALAQHLASGSGADDIEAVEESFIAQFRAQPQNFVNLLDLGAGQIKDRWLPWKWQQSLSADGKVQIGLGTDVGSLAMCYRKDLLAKAGLPTDRQAVSKLWPTWQDYIAAGRRFEAAGTGAHWFDAGNNIYTAIVRQSPSSYYTTDNRLIIDSNPAVKRAWDLTAQAIQAGESAKLPAFTPPWNAAFKQGAFATITCPAWMLAYIQDQAPATKGKWDIASVPGGGGNWGGSFLTIPKQSKHPREAYDLAAWLTAPEQELTLFKTKGILPSQPALYDDPAVRSYKNSFFSNAPVGEIFASTAKSLQPQYLGPKSGPIQQAIQNGILRLEQGRQTSEEAWRQAVRDAERVAG